MKNQIVLSSLIILIAIIFFGNCGGPGNQKTDQVGDIKSHTILMVVGDDNETVEKGEGTGDLFIRNRLEKVLDHQVNLIHDTASQNSFNEAVEKADMVIVSESVHSLNVRDKLKSVTIPVLSYEAFIQDDMGMTAKEPHGDPGEPEEFAYGVREKDTGIDIIMPDHPLAAGLKGHVTIYREPREVTWGKVGEGAKVIATLTGHKDAAVIYLYDKGARLFDDTEAAGMRIGFFLEEENITGTSNFMTEDGLLLFDTAVKFALDPEEE